MAYMVSNWYRDDDGWHYQSVFSTTDGRRVDFRTGRDWRGALVSSAEAVAPEGRYARAWIESDRWIGQDAHSISWDDVRKQHEVLTCDQRPEVLADIEAYFERIRAHVSNP